MKYEVNDYDVRSLVPLVARQHPQDFSFLVHEKTEYFVP